LLQPQKALALAQSAQVGRGVLLYPSLASYILRAVNPRCAIFRVTLSLNAHGICSLSLIALSTLKLSAK
jgi:hypothetical protein